MGRRSIRHPGRRRCAYAPCGREMPPERARQMTDKNAGPIGYRYCSRACVLAAVGLPPDFDPAVLDARPAGPTKAERLYALLVTQPRPMAARELAPLVETADICRVEHVSTYLFDLVRKGRVQRTYPADGLNAPGHSGPPIGYYEAIPASEGS